MKGSEGAGESRKLVGTERVAGLIPGVSGYLKKEMARESDHRYRLGLSEHVDGIRSRITAMQKSLTDQGILKGLDKLDRINRKLATLEDRLRFAPRGYSGMFDGAKVKQAELETLIAYDHSLAGDIEIMENAVNSTTDIADLVSGLDSKINCFLDLLDKRNRLFDPESGVK